MNSSWMSLCLVAVTGALFAAPPNIHAGVPPLLDVPNYFPPDVKQDFDNKRGDLEKRIEELRKEAQSFNSKYAGRTFPEGTADAKIGLKEKAKLDKAGQDYSRDASAFDEQVSKIIDSMVVDARNVPTGLSKDVEESIPHTASGDRVRKGFEAIADADWRRHDWKVASAWFQDALNHDPTNTGIKRLVDFAQYMVSQRTAAHTLAFENSPPPTQKTPPAPTALVESRTNPDLKADMEQFFKDVIESRIKSGKENQLQMTESNDDMETFYKEVIEPRRRTGDHKLVPSRGISEEMQRTEEASWSEFIEWMNDNFAPKN